MTALLPPDRCDLHAPAVVFFDLPLQHRCPVCVALEKAERDVELARDVARETESELEVTMGYACMDEGCPCHAVHDEACRQARATGMANMVRRR